MPGGFQARVEVKESLLDEIGEGLRRRGQAAADSREGEELISHRAQRAGDPGQVRRH